MIVTGQPFAFASALRALRPASRCGPFPALPPLQPSSTPLPVVTVSTGRAVGQWSGRGPHREACDLPHCPRSTWISTLFPACPLSLLLPTLQYHPITSHYPHIPLFPHSTSTFHFLLSLHFTLLPSLQFLVPSPQLPLPTPYSSVPILEIHTISTLPLSHSLHSLLSHSPTPHFLNLHSPLSHSLLSHSPLSPLPLSTLPAYTLHLSPYIPLPFPTPQHPLHGRMKA